MDDRKDILRFSNNGRQEGYPRGKSLQLKEKASQFELLPARHRTGIRHLATELKGGNMAIKVNESKCSLGCTDLSHLVQMSLGVGLDWINLAQDRDRWRVFVNAGNFLSS
jgi:hypothetical protein